MDRFAPSLDPVWSLTLPPETSVGAIRHADTGCRYRAAAQRMTTTKYGQGTRGVGRVSGSPKAMSVPPGSTAAR
jgi:hypothetical protein